MLKRNVGALIGKAVAQRLYVHVSALGQVDAVRKESLRKAESAACIDGAECYNVARFDPAGAEIALLNYPEFFDEPFSLVGSAEDAIIQAQGSGTGIWQ